MKNKDVDVAKLNDLDLRKNLTESGLAVGPVTSKKIKKKKFCHREVFLSGLTRAIYQRKLLEVLTNETSEGDIIYFNCRKEPYLFLL